MDGCRSAGSPRRLISAVFIFFSHYCTSPGAAYSFRGVHPLDENYFVSKVINCKDGSNSFTVDRVNDDFCDCVDGTDEPGTSACPKGKFYCANAGSVPKFLHSSLVNDHICDCCDGSDEYDGVIHCPNTCIMGGNIEFKAEFHRRSTGNRVDAVDAKESRSTKTLEDMIHNVIGLKVLAIIQLVFLLIVFSFHFLRRRSKSRRGRFRPDGYT
ncbi:hypothetical protein V2J09_012040 [Rumex salicifolius]